MVSIINGTRKKNTPPVEFVNPSDFSAKNAFLIQFDDPLFKLKTIAVTNTLHSIISFAQAQQILMMNISG